LYKIVAKGEEYFRNVIFCKFGDLKFYRVCLISKIYINSLIFIYFLVEKHFHH